MSDAAEKVRAFVRDQAEAVQLAREQYAEDFSGSLGHRRDALDMALRLAEARSDTPTVEQLLRDARQLATWLAGHAD